jgi:hypothetical protein
MAFCLINVNAVVLRYSIVIFTNKSLNILFYWLYGRYFLNRAFAAHTVIWQLTFFNFLSFHGAD